VYVARKRKTQFWYGSLMGRDRGVDRRVNIKNDLDRSVLNF
jgi:hypothetical protein